VNAVDESANDHAKRLYWDPDDMSLLDEDPLPWLHESYRDEHESRRLLHSFRHDLDPAVSLLFRLSNTWEVTSRKRLKTAHYLRKVMIRKGSKWVEETLQNNGTDSEANRRNASEEVDPSTITAGISLPNNRNRFDDWSEDVMAEVKKYDGLQTSRGGEGGSVLEELEVLRETLNGIVDRFHLKERE